MMKKNKLSTYILLQGSCILLPLLSILLIAAPTCSAAPAKPLHVLMLYSWHKDMPWQLAFEKGFRQELTAAKQSVRLYAEYLDAGRFPEAVQQEALYNYLTVKYSSTRLDLIIAESDPAVTFFKKHRQLFPGVRQILFQTDCQHKDSLTDSDTLSSRPSGEGQQNMKVGQVPRTSLSSLSYKNYLTVKIITDFDSSVSEMLRLATPNKLFVVADTADSNGVNRLASFKETLQRKAPRLQTEFFINLPLENLLEKVSCLPDGSAIFYLLVFHDGHGRHLTPFQAAQKISARAGAPIFSHWETLMGSGILGGYLLSGERIGKIAARSVTAHVEDKPFNFNPQEAYGNYYDWQKLTSWGIEKKRLPADTVLFNSPPGIWEYYRWQIVSLSVFLFLVLVVSFLCYRNNMIKKLNHELRLLSTTDSLTGLLNRRAIKPLIDKEMHRKKRFNHPVSFLLIDIDRFKQVNDQYGHAAGDKVIVDIATAVSALVRKTDNIARWGGEEFAILVTNTGIRHALVLAEKVRKTVMEISFQKIETVTVSIGVAEYHPDENFQQWYERADRALYKAKRKGRNRVVADQYTLPTDIPVKSGLRIAWKEDYYSGHPVIDKQHMELINQANHLIDAILTGTEERIIDTIAENLLLSLKEHFTYEEQILAQIEYPQLQRHKDEHLSLLTTSEGLIDQFRTGCLDFFKLIQFISQDALAGHLDSSDKDYFKWLKVPL